MKALYRYTHRELEINPRFVPSRNVPANLIPMSETVLVCPSQGCLEKIPMMWLSSSLSYSPTETTHLGSHMSNNRSSVDLFQVSYAAVCRNAFNHFSEYG